MLTVMAFFNGLWLLALGVLGASSLIISKRPDAQDVIGKLSKYQGWFGAISVVWGVVALLNALFNIGIVAYRPVFWLLLLAAAVLIVAIGFLLGLGVLKTFVTSPEAQAKMDQTVARLQPFQSKFGVAGIAVGVLMVLFSLFYVI